MITSTGVTVQRSPNVTGEQTEAASPMHQLHEPMQQTKHESMFQHHVSAVEEVVIGECQSNIEVMTQKAALPQELSTAQGPENMESFLQVGATNAD